MAHGSYLYVAVVLTCLAKKSEPSGILFHISLITSTKYNEITFKEIKTVQIWQECIPYLV